MRANLRLYTLLLRASVRGAMQHKFNFIGSAIVSALVQFSEFLMVALVLVKFGSVDGWSWYEIGYLCGVMTLARALYRSVASDVHYLEKYLVTGDLDPLLLRPVPLLLALMTQNVRLLAGDLAQGALLVTLCLRELLADGRADWTAVPFTLLAVVSGAVLLFAIGLATASCGFWLTRIEALQNMTEDAARSAAQYPLTLYPQWMRTLLLVALPVGFVSYVPALYIVRGSYGPWLPLAAAGAAAVFLLLALRLWAVGVSRYQSTGS
ncbi:ABC-2 family transporter protein [Paenibacillus athensensis]|uniref:ABC transporter permease n=1 Tax=Paenibacillus athensensis TaxID=1967502 RepID=A0A4Y8PY14_9BACL|nr:ABC-2 family transporter protein [Paenibacillus athensensis]MCD1259638.1 ABC-2 family transporter protein [Paenibacillus athensensis]